MKKLNDAEPKLKWREWWIQSVRHALPNVAKEMAFNYPAHEIGLYPMVHVVEYSALLKAQEFQAATMRLLKSRDAELEAEKARAKVLVEALENIRVLSHQEQEIDEALATYNTKGE